MYNSSIGIIPQNGKRRKTEDTRRKHTRGEYGCEVKTDRFGKLAHLNEVQDNDRRTEPLQHLIKVERRNLGVRVGLVHWKTDIKK